MTQEIEEFLKKENIKIVAKLPYDETFTMALAEAKPIVEYSENSPLSNLVKDSWQEIKTIIRNQK